MKNENHKQKVPKEKVIQILKKAQTDLAFRKRLKEHPEATLKAEGITLNPNIHIKFLEKEENTLYYILPPMGEELSDEQIMKMAAGMSSTPNPKLSSWCRGRCGGSCSLCGGQHETS